MGFYGVTGSSSSSCGSSSYFSSLKDFGPLHPQTPVQTILQQQQPEQQLERAIVARYYPAIGVLVERVGANMASPRGAAILVASNLVLVPRHCVQMKAWSVLLVRFSDGHSSFERRILGVVESTEAQVDYVLLLIEPLGIVPVRLPLAPEVEPAWATGAASSKLLLFHYPLGCELHQLAVSLHKSCKGSLASSPLLELYHDSDAGSSGGAYLDVDGYLVAMHLGSGENPMRMCVQRYALPIAYLYYMYPQGRLRQLARGQTQTGQLVPNIAVLPWLEFPALQELEGYWFDKEEARLLAAGLTPAAAQLATIRTVTQFGGRYGSMLKYSKQKLVESDHFPPKSVYAGAPSRSRVARVEVADMASLNLEYHVHRPFITTGRRAEAVAFRALQHDDFAAEKWRDAIVRNMDEYKKAHIMTPNNKGGVQNALSQHVTNGLLTQTQAHALLTKYYP